MACMSDPQVLGVLQGRLESQERAAIEAHLDSCTRCRELITLAGKSSLAIDPHARDASWSATTGAAGPEVGPGTRIGRYEVEEPLGRGAIGTVYSARDSQLGRRVALKLVTPRVARDPRSQLAVLREAQVMARITQPNVLTIYDVGVFGDVVFLAAERVDGDTLDVWLAQPRRWRQIIDVFLQAARGIEAAYAAGLVHLDFDPSNALVGHDGRVRMVDFGSARRQDIATTGGELVGAPRYMSPEQRRGDVGDARAAQYAFCLALYEALFGAQPGSPARTRRAAGVIHRPPEWLRHLVARGLELEPARRFPTMRALIDAVDRRLARRRHGMIAGVAALAVAAASTTAVVGYLRGVNGPLASCPAPALAAWTPAVRAKLGAKIAATGVAFAPAAWASAAHALDLYAARWRNQQRASCLAFAAHASQDAAAHHRRATCLERDRIVLEAIVDRIAVADRSVVAQLPQLLASLPDLDACARSELPAWPADAGARSELVDHYRAVARISSLADAGRFADAGRELGPVIARAATLGFAGADADAHYLAGRIASLGGDYVEAARLLEAARWKAEAARHDELVVNATAELLWVIGSGQRKSSATRPLINHASAAADRVGSPAARLRAARAIGVAETSAGNYAAAAHQLETARLLAASIAPPDRLQLAGVLHELGSLAMRQRRYAQAEPLRRRAIELASAELGPAHPWVARLKGSLANTLASLDRREEARTTFEDAIARLDRELGPEHAELPEVLDAFGHLLLRTGELARARALFERSLAISDKVLPAGHPMRTTALVSLGVAAQVEGRRGDAEQLARRVFEIQRAELGRAHHATIDTAFQIANLALRRGDHAGARTMCEALLDDEIKDPWTRASGVTCLGEADLVAGRRAEALRVLTRALAMYPPHHDPYGAAWTQFLIATALPATERRRALELADAAHARIRNEPAYFKYELDRIAAWLAKARPREAPGGR
jgi:eukaryotic-like serine/threonine-protein kinase